MFTEYELYSDERVVRHEGSRYLFLGGVICTDNGRVRLQGELETLPTFDDLDLTKLGAKALRLNRHPHRAGRSMPDAESTLSISTRGVVLARGEVVAVDLSAGDWGSCLVPHEALDRKAANHPK